VPITTLGTPDARLGTVTLGASAGGSATVRNIFLQVNIGGNQVQNVFGGRVSLGFDQAVSEATVECGQDPGGSYNDLVEVSMGAGTNNALRFRGLLKEKQSNLYPRTVTLVARGVLSRAEEYVLAYDPADPVQSAAAARALQNAGISGLLVQELVGSSGQTDGNVVYQALARVPELDVDPGNLDDTGTVVGQSEAFNNWAWKFGTSALAYVQEVDKVARMRTFESIGGTIYRRRITGWPAPAAEYTFTEAVDIFSGRGARTIIGLKNSVYVTGADLGRGDGPVFAFIVGGNAFQAEPVWEYFSSPLIERGTNADPLPTGFSCQDVATDLYAEVNRETVRLTLTTPRDDVIGPGQTHMVRTVDGAPDRLLIAEPLWVQRVDIEVNGGAFSQTMTYIGGGEATGEPPPINWGGA
jgi:hypothetical protein